MGNLNLILFNFLKNKIIFFSNRNKSLFLKRIMHCGRKKWMKKMNNKRENKRSKRKRLVRKKI
jgi:hypothetical protein